MALHSPSQSGSCSWLGIQMQPVYCFVPGASSDPAVQSYELRIQQSGDSQILIGNESCRGRTKNTVRARTASRAIQPAQK